MRSQKAARFFQTNPQAVYELPKAQDGDELCLATEQEL